MGLPSIFEVFQLAIGPSMVYTTGALRIGQAFRDLLISNRYRADCRILVELAGDFSRYGKENQADQAVIAGLGGFKPEEAGTSMTVHFNRIRENGCFLLADTPWPFNPESDLTFSDPDQHPGRPGCIRFHLLNTGNQPFFQAEYRSVGNGAIQGTGIPETGDPRRSNAPECLSDIEGILVAQNFSPFEYILSDECSRHGISTAQFIKRMQVTWRLMMANTDRGLKPRLGQDGALPGQASGIYRNYLMHLATNPSSAGDYTRASVYATALAEDMLNHFPVITAPTCYGSAIVPAVMRLVQDRFMFTDEKMVEGLAVGGLFGSILLKELNASASPASPQTEIACSAVMAAAGTEYLTGGTMRDIERAASMAAVLFGGAGHQDSPIGQAAFILMNSMVAQGSLPLTDLSGIEPDVLVPRFGDAMHDLFHR